MKQKMKACLLMLMMISILAAMAGCGAAGMDSVETVAASAPAMEEYVVSGEGSVEMVTDAAMEAGEFSSSVYQDPDAKLIREANLSIQTTEFEQAMTELEGLVAELGGYFQNASLRGGSYRNVNANRSGDYTIRIPAEQYDQFMGRTGGLGYVTYRNETTENIGEQYYDTEARLKTQKTKQERLLSLLEKAENMEDIISLETALSDVEYEIERLSSTLNRYDSLVGFSTIYLTLDEVHKVSEETGVTNTLGQRMVQGFSSSVDGLIEGTQDLLVWVSYHVFGLLVAAAAIICAVAVVVRRRSKKKLVVPKVQNQTEA